MTFVFAVGIFSGNPLIAFVGGAATICIEIYALGAIAKFLDKFPGERMWEIKIRTAMSKVLESCINCWRMIAADAMASVLGIYL